MSPALILIAAYRSANAAARESARMYNPAEYTPTQIREAAESAFRCLWGLHWMGGLGNSRDLLGELGEYLPSETDN